MGPTLNIMRATVVPEAPKRGEGTPALTLKWIVGRLSILRITSSFCNMVCFAAAPWMITDVMRSLPSSGPEGILVTTRPSPEEPAAHVKQVLGEQVARHKIEKRKGQERGEDAL